MGLRHRGAGGLTSRAYGSALGTGLQHLLELAPFLVWKTGWFSKVHGSHHIVGPILEEYWDLGDVVRVGATTRCEVMSWTLALPTAGFHSFEIRSGQYQAHLARETLYQIAWSKRSLRCQSCLPWRPEEGIFLPAPPSTHSTQFHPVALRARSRQSKPGRLWPVLCRWRIGLVHDALRLSRRNA
jgi:hypothetical protein